jgi:hypothetical protein
LLEEFGVYLVFIGWKLVAEQALVGDLVVHEYQEWVLVVDSDTVSHLVELRPCVPVLHDGAIQFCLNDLGVQKVHDL